MDRRSTVRRRKVRSYSRASLEHLERRVLLSSQQLITNPSFSAGSQGWSESGDFWIGTNLSNYHTSPGYAAGGVDSTGMAKNSASGHIDQQITIPQNATAATLQFWYNITTTEATTSTAFDKFDIQLTSSTGQTTLVTEYSNLNKTSGYLQSPPFNLLSVFPSGTYTLTFKGTTDSSNPTTFRIDDVNLNVTTPDPTPPTTLALGSGDTSSPGPGISALTPTFQWNNTPPDTGYGLYIKDAVTNAFVYPNAAGATNSPLQGSSFTLPAGVLQSGHQYKWNMTGFVNGTESSAVSTLRYFQADLAAPALSAPADGDKAVALSPTFQWSSVTGNHGYRLIVDTTQANLPTDPASSSDPTALINTTVGADVNTFSPVTALSPGTTYYWEVHALGDPAIGQVGIWSTPSGFSTASPVTPQVPVLNSLPGAHAKLFLDFDGAAATTWNTEFHNGVVSVPAIAPFDIDGDPTTFSTGELAAIQEIWSRVAEKYSPFNLDVTTVDPGNRDDFKVMCVVVDSNSSWYTAVDPDPAIQGDAGSIGGFVNGYSNTAYVFADRFQNNPFLIGEGIAHEAGHGFGLVHQMSDTQPYYAPSGPRAPIMGRTDFATRGLWWRTNEFPGQNSTQPVQDDLAILSDATANSKTANGFGYRPDDHGDTIGSADALAQSGNFWTGQGVIERTSDADAFSFTCTGGTLALAVNVATFGPMLDAREELRDSSGNLIASADSPSLSEALTASVPAGTYYLIVRSNGDYGDVGQYTVSGSLAPSPLIEVTSPSSSAVTSGQPTPVDLGSVSQYAPPTAMTFTVRNAGSLPLSLGSISLPAGFILVSNPVRPVDPGATTTFSVGVDSSSSGAKSGVISFATNDAQSPTFSFSATATVAAITGSSIYLRMDADHAHADLWVDAASPGQGTPTQLATLPSGPFQFTGGPGSNLLTVDCSAGVPLPTGGVIFDPGTGVTTLRIVGTAGNDQLTVGTTTATFSNASTSPVLLNVGHLTAIEFAGGGGGNDSVSLTGGSYNIDANTAAGIPNISLAVAAGASAAIDTDQRIAGLAIHGGSVLLSSNTAVSVSVAGPLTIDGGGTLDLGRGSLLVTTSPDIAAYIARAAGPAQPNGLNAWAGTGLTSSLVQVDAANGNAKQLAVGYFDSRDNSQTGLSVPVGQTLVKVTVYGDATGDGKVSIADLSVWNNNFGASTPRWSQGDFNYDGRVNIADLSVWNNDFGNNVANAMPAATATAAPPLSSTTFTGSPSATVQDLSAAPAAVRVAPAADVRDAGGGMAAATQEVSSVAAPSNSGGVEAVEVDRVSSNAATSRINVQRGVHPRTKTAARQTVPRAQVPTPQLAGRPQSTTAAFSTKPIDRTNDAAMFALAEAVTPLYWQPGKASDVMPRWLRRRG